MLPGPGGNPPQGVLDIQKAQEELSKNQQQQLKDAIEDGGAIAKGRVLDAQGAEVQRLANKTLNQIPGATVQKNAKIGKGIGSEIDNVVTMNGKTVYVESKLTIADINQRTINQLTNAVKAAKPGDSVFLHVARQPTPAELASLKNALGSDVYDKIKIVSCQTDLYTGVAAALE
jgi:hypothetical protein